MDEIISTDKMDDIQAIIKAAEYKETYQFDFNVNQYKMDFANLMATLEFAKNQVEEIAEILVAEMVIPDNTKNAKTNKKVKISSVMRAVLASKQFRYAGSTAAVFAISVASGLIAASTIGKGGF